MAPTHIPVFVSQKPSTKYKIYRPADLLLAWVGEAARALARVREAVVAAVPVVGHVVVLYAHDGRLPGWHTHKARAVRYTMGGCLHKHTYNL